MYLLGKILARLTDDLGALRIRWALVGGMAVGIHGEIRTTRDIDIAIAVGGEEEASAAVLGLRLRGYRDHPAGAVVEHPDGRLATVRLVSPFQGESSAVIDLLFLSSGIESEIVAAAPLFELEPGLIVPVARAGHLLALKVLAGRLKDLEDARQIIKRIQPDEMQRARESLALVTKRGLHRGKDLMAELARVISLASDPSQD